MATAAEGFRIELMADGPIARLRLIGDVDAVTSPVLDLGLSESCIEGVAEVVLDCSELAFIDSSGLSVLIANHKRLQERGVTLVIESAPPAARRLFDISGLDRLLTIR